MDVTEKWGDNIDSAVELALTDLKASRDEVEIEVLEQPSRGFFGIGSKLALVRVTRKKEEPQLEPEPVISEVPEIPETPVEKPVEEFSEISSDSTKPDSEEEVDWDALAQENDWNSNPGRPIESYEGFGEKRERPARNEGRKSSRKKNSKKKEKAERTLPKRNPRLDELDFHKTMDGLPIVENHPAEVFLKEVTDQMGLKLEMIVKADDRNVYVDIEGEDSGTIIGKRGATLDAIQYLTSLVINREKEGYIKVVVDAENYRSKRERTLEQLANKLAGKVVRTKRSVRLEPMNPYERKVIHATLQDDPKVKTRSEGQDPYRRVIIELK